MKKKENGILFNGPSRSTHVEIHGASAFWGSETHESRGERALNDSRRFHIVFVYSRSMPHPPSVDNIKAYYVSREFVRRGAKVTWLQIGDIPAKWEKDGIEFVKMGSPAHRLIRLPIQLIQMIAFCRLTNVNCVYSDEWLFFRKEHVNRLFFQIGLKILGVRYAFDQRDPFVDYEIAKGNLREGSCKHRRLELLNNLALRLTDLAIFPSEIYADESRSRGLPAKNSIGTIRGIDGQHFQSTGRR